MHSIVRNSFIRLLNKNVFLSTNICVSSFMMGNFREYCIEEIKQRSRNVYEIMHYNCHNNVTCQ
jgi:hypothetical protein